LDTTTSPTTNSNQQEKNCKEPYNILDEYIDKELALCKMVGPFEKYELPNVHISRFGVILKHHQLDQWRLIIDFSYPKKYSINDGIPKDLCGLCVG